MLLGPRQLGGAAIALLLLAGCAVPTSVVPTPVGTSNATASLGSSQPTLSASEIDAIHFRSTVGLRSDVGWIRQVAADPSSNVLAYGVPLTAVESAELDARPRSSEGVARAIYDYGHLLPGWAGLYVDTGVVVGMFTDTIARHRTALARLLNPAAHWDLTQAMWSAAELSGFKARLTSDEDWLASIGAVFESSLVDTPGNRIVLRISSKDARAPALIIDHFNGERWLRVQSDGVGPWSGPRGTLAVRVLSASGVPVENAECVPEPDVGSAFESGDVGILTSSEGWCVVSGVGATWFDVDIFVSLGGRHKVGTGRALVLANAVVELTIKLQE